MRKFTIPNMGALTAFESAARHESFTHAAKELHLTESAISRQIAALESKLGVRLFVRASQRVALTRAGRLYATQVRRALEHLDRDTLSIIAHGHGGQFLELAALPTFASHWLLPRLADFYARCPDIRVNMDARTDMFTFRESHFEAAIHYGKPTWPGVTADFLFGEEVAPVCSPRLLDATVSKPSDLLRYPLLHSSTRPDAWARWFSHHGVKESSTIQGGRYELHTMLIAAAAAGLGVALIPVFFVENQLEQLGLIQPVEAAAIEDSAYYLVYPTELNHSKPLDMFRSWLLEQAHAYNAAKAGTSVIGRNP